MKFESGKPNGHVTVISFGSGEKPKPMPEPEVGKIYRGFDDGKISFTRLVDWKIVKRIDLDNDKVSKYLLRLIQQAIKECYWLFDTEQIIIYRAYAVNKKGKYNREIGYCYYLRTKEGGWFGANNGFWNCELDIDNRWYNELVKEEV